MAFGLAEPAATEAGTGRSRDPGRRVERTFVNGAWRGRAAVSGRRATGREEDRTAANGRRVKGRTSESAERSPVGPGLGDVPFDFGNERNSDGAGFGRGATLAPSETALNPQNADMVG